jgi:preprotein translocase SecE subunit
MAQVVKSDKLDQDSDPSVPVPTVPAPSKKPPIKAVAPKMTANTNAPGFFAIYKRSQGYWTRMGTAIAATVIGACVAYNLYKYLPPFLPMPEQGSMSNEQFAFATAQAETLHTHIALGVSLGFLAVYALVGWYLMNKPSNVEFLIATDVEMKKVNWTSRRELIGSTKVVVSFMFLTAIFLFAVDMIFRLLMQLIGVLNKGAPF